MGKQLSLNNMSLLYTKRDCNFTRYLWWRRWGFLSRKSWIRDRAATWTPDTILSPLHSSYQPNGRKVCLETVLEARFYVKKLHQKKFNKSSPKSFGKSHVSTLHGREWTCLLYNAHCTRVQSYSHRYVTSTPHRQTHDDGKYCASIVSCKKNISNSNLADI